MFVSVTRLRIRNVWFLPLFAVHALRSVGQVKKAAGFQTGALLNDRDWTFWTLTGWDSGDSMRQYMTAGAHAKSMRHLMHWCDEASVVHWDQADDTLPPWTEADRRMRSEGRASKVKHPSAAHTSLTYRQPRTTQGGPIQRAQ